MHSWKISAERLEAYDHIMALVQNAAQYDHTFVGVLF
jgi:hypothetical protein